MTEFFAWPVEHKHLSLVRPELADVPTAALQAELDARYRNRNYLRVGEFQMQRDTHTASFKGHTAILGPQEAAMLLEIASAYPDGISNLRLKNAMPGWGQWYGMTHAMRNLRTILSSVRRKMKSRTLVRTHTFGMRAPMLTTYYLEPT